MQKARPHSLRSSDCCVSCRFQVYFTPLPGFFSPFPRGTCALSGFDTYLALEGGPPSFPSGSTCPMVLGNLPHSVRHTFYLQDCHLLWWTIPGPSARCARETSPQHGTPGRPHNPPTATRVGYHTIGVWAVARSLAATRAISVDFSSADTEMFHFTACCRPRLCIGRGLPPHNWRRVPPFGDLRINACLRLPGAYRSLPRPSSPIETKASTGSSW